MTKQHLIWDLPTRIFHWAFALVIIGCWATHELGSEYIDWHMQLGYVAIGLLCFRVIWGFIGTKHARFASFFPTPTKIKRYLSDDKRKVAGHNPLGSLMVFAMLVLVMLQAASGLFIDDEIFTTGPYFNALGSDVDKVMSMIHHNAFDIIAIAIFVHVAAVVFYQRVKKQNLVKPMVTGYKNEDDINTGDAISGSKVWLGVIIALLCAGFVYWLVVINAPVVEEYW